MAADRTPNELADALDRLADGATLGNFPTQNYERGAGVLLDAAALLRVQAEQLDTLRNAIGDPDLLLDRAAALRSANTHRRLSDYLVALADAADALAAAGGGVPEEGATDEQ